MGIEGQTGQSGQWHQTQILRLKSWMWRRLLWPDRAGGIRPTARAIVFFARHLWAVGFHALIFAFPDASASNLQPCVDMFCMTPAASPPCCVLLGGSVCHLIWGLPASTPGHSFADQVDDVISLFVSMIFNTCSNTLANCIVTLFVLDAVCHREMFVTPSAHVSFFELQISVRALRHYRLAGHERRGLTKRLLSWPCLLRRQSWWPSAPTNERRRCRCRLAVPSCSFLVVQRNDPRMSTTRWSHT
jgi:hypothetical protein